MTGSAPVCPQCTQVIQGSDRFCGSCGASLADIRRVNVPRPAEGGSACADCGNTAFADGYCTACGHRRSAPDRDQAELAGVALVTDRGLEHHQNEDAAAAGMLGGRGRKTSTFVIAVSDGVSTSEDPQLASGAAAGAGVEAMLTALAASSDPRAALVAGLTAAAAAAARAGAQPSSAPSCTYTAAVVVPGADGTAQVTVGNVGDSRAYWLPENPDGARQLTVDDSLAHELIASGMPADSPAVLRAAHTITRWLGADADAQPWADSSVQSLTVTGPGTVLLCSDGLWNYVPEAGDLARFCAGKQPPAAAQELTEFALAAGGQDNITVAVLPIGGGHREFT